jgi:group I intron endonuclease
MIGLYAIVHKHTNRAYVGSAVNLKRRFKEHRTLLKQGVHHSAYLQNAWNKYGVDQFEFKVIKPLDSLTEARELEQALLDCFYKDTMNCKPSAIGFPFGDAHHAKRPDFHMKSVMQRLTPEERKQRYGKAKGTTRASEPYILAAKKRLSDPEFTKRLSEACKGKRKLVTCPKCRLVGGGGNMKRYHFDRCKK